MLIDLLYFIFSKKKCLVYTAFGSSDYSKVIGKLQNSGIPYRTRIISNNSSRHNHYVGRTINTQYDIFVKKEDEHRALNAIHN